MAEENSVKTTILLRYDTAENWTSAVTAASDEGSDLILKKGEVGIIAPETDDNGAVTGLPLVKIGDGKTGWDGLPALNNFNSEQFTIGDNGLISLAEGILNGNSGTSTAIPQYVDAEVRDSTATTQGTALPILAVDTSNNRVVNTGVTINDLQTAINNIKTSSETGTVAIATNVTTGTVMGSTEQNKISVESDGTMTINSISTDKLIAGTNTLTLDCGGA